MLNDSGPSSIGESKGEGGGLYPQLLERLESLRWLLVKSAVAIVVGMVVCLSTGNYLVRILEWPLRRGERQGILGPQQLVLQLGTNQIFHGALPSNVFGAFPLGTNRVASLRLVPRIVGTNLSLVFEPGDPVPENLAASGRLFLKTLGPMAAFTVAIDLAIYGGIVLASPFIFFFIGQFFLPFLKAHERARAVLVRISLAMFLLFVAGMAFCYFLLLPIALYGSIEYARWLHFTADTWMAEDYIGFVCKFCLGMGMGFQLPVLLLGLVKIRVLNYERLVKFRVYWLVINLILSAVITPDGNPLTMVLMAAPLQVLFEISLWIARFWERNGIRLESTQS